jgi:RHS repeat-associated protein
MPVVNYLWNPLNDNIVREFDDAGTVIAEYTTEANQFGNVVSQRRNGQDSVYHYDGQGSTLALTDADGSITDTYAYSAFGEVTAHTGNTVNPFQYVGQKGYYLDEETRECDVRRRTISTSRHRWLSPDPLWSSKHQSDYVYGGNSPAIAIDPSGLAIIREGHRFPTRGGPYEPPEPQCSTVVYESIVAKCTFWRIGRRDPWEETIDCPGGDDMDCCLSRTNDFWPRQHGWEVQDSELLKKIRTVTTCTRWVSAAFAMGLIRQTPQPVVAVHPCQAEPAVGRVIVVDIALTLIPYQQTTTSQEIEYESVENKRKRKPFQCRCTIRYIPDPDRIAWRCPGQVYGTGTTMRECQRNAKFTAPERCRAYYAHCGKVW